MPGSPWPEAPPSLTVPCLFPIRPTAPGLHASCSLSLSLSPISAHFHVTPSPWKACPHLFHLVHLFSASTSSWNTLKPIPAPPYAEWGAPSVGLLSNLYTPCPRPHHLGLEGPAYVSACLLPTRLWATYDHVLCLIHPLVLLAQSSTQSWIDEQYLILPLGNRGIMG